MDFQVAHTSSINSPCLVHLMYLVQNVVVDVGVQQVQFTTSSRRLDGGAYCGAPVGGKCMVSKAKLVLYAFAV